MGRMRVLIAVLLASLNILTLADPVASAADCTFVLGFQAIHDQIPDTVGECVVDQHYNPDNGDALQETSGGMLVWRKADNFTAFTDGYRSWVNGPYGLQERLNTDRFNWEKDGLAPTPATQAPSPPTTAPAPTRPTPTPTPRPTQRPSVPAGATAICRDGTYSYSQNRSGTCSWHGGVAQWLY